MPNNYQQYSWMNNNEQESMYHWSAKLEVHLVWPATMLKI
jgi:hypothetical protein